MKSSSVRVGHGYDVHRLVEGRRLILGGEEIPFEARIVSVADAFDAMSCDRPYRQALRRDVVVAEFKRYATQQFDPAITAVFLEILAEGICDADATQMAESPPSDDEVAAQPSA